MRCAAETHPEQHVGDNFTWTREYNPGLSQSHFTAQTVNDDKYMTGMEVRPNYGLYSSIPKHNARLEHPIFFPSGIQHRLNEKVKILNQKEVSTDSENNSKIQEIAVLN